MRDYTLTRVDGSTVGLPVGWYVERYEPDPDDSDLRVEFKVYQEGGSTWQQTGEPRPEISVELTRYERRFGEPGKPEVSWPSTSDKRPVLARALAAALHMAADEAEEEES